MPMPEGFDPTSGFPLGVRAVKAGDPLTWLVRVGCNGDPARGVAAWTSYEKPKLTEEAQRRLELDRQLFGDCYVTLEGGELVSPLDAIVLGRPSQIRASLGEREEN